MVMGMCAQENTTVHTRPLQTSWCMKYLNHANTQVGMVGRHGISHDLILHKYT